MGILTDADIRANMDLGKMAIEPFREDSLTPNGYDLEVAEVMLPGSGQSWEGGAARVPSMTRFMVSTRERVRLGPGLTAQLWLRTTWARRGVLASFGKVDAGFDGTLTLAAFNASASPLEVPVGGTFAQLVVEELSGEAEAVYPQRSGHYQDQRGVTLARDGEGGGLPAPCLERGCHECCVDTEMPLTRDDVQRLEGRGHDPREFSTRGEDGYTFLRNVGRSCYFLGNDGRCTEYAHRPEGCRLYPLVLDDEMDEYVTDGVCPHGSEVEPTEEHKGALLALLDRLARERGAEGSGPVRKP